VTFKLREDEVGAWTANWRGTTRRQRPLATTEQIATRIIEWLTDDELLVLAEEALGWHQEPAGRRALALLAVRNFVAAMEDPP